MASSRKSKKQVADLEDLEKELYSDKGADAYTKDVQDKTDRKLLVSNLLESKE